MAVLLDGSSWPLPPELPDPPELLIELVQLARSPAVPPPLSLPGSEAPSMALMPLSPLLLFPPEGRV